jgi:hypothetical protein
MEDLTGKQLGPYQIIAPLGAGGMASVFKAYQPSMEREVAIKVLPRQYSSSEEFVARFKQEARLLARLQHPHILPVFDSGTDDGYSFIVMPAITGGSLKDIMTGAPMPVERAAKIVAQVGDALDYAHANGLVHRDVKPSNVLLDNRGNALLMDFGIARMVEATTRLTQAGGVIGTPAYMSPEQSTGQSVDARSDIYALGIVLFELVTGRVPYHAETPLAVLFKHVNDPLPMPRTLNPALTEALERVILKSLAKRPQDRYQKMSEFVAALQQVVPFTGTNPQATPAEAVTQVLPGSAPAAPAATAPRPAPAPSSVGAAQTGQTQRGKSALWVGLGAASLVGILACVAITFLGLRRFAPGAVPALTATSVGIATPQVTATEVAASPPTSQVVVEPSATQAVPSDSESAVATAQADADKIQATIDAIGTSIPTPLPDNTPASTETPTPTEGAYDSGAGEAAGAEATVVFQQSFVGGEVQDDEAPPNWVWLNEEGTLTRDQGLKLSSKEDGFPALVTRKSPFPEGDLRLRVAFAHNDLNACGVGVFATSYQPLPGADQAAADAIEANELEAGGIRIGVWRDATYGMRAGFYSKDNRIEKNVASGANAVRVMIIDYVGGEYVLSVDGVEVLRTKSTQAPVYLMAGNTTTIDTCAGYWTSLTLRDVAVWKGIPEPEKPGVNAADKCTPAWFFAPPEAGCLLSARAQRVVGQRFARGFVLFLSATNQSFIFNEDTGVWKNVQNNLETAIGEAGNGLGNKVGERRAWRACAGHIERGDEVTAYLSDASRRILAWTVQKSTGKPLRWGYVDGATFLGCR